MSEKLTITKLFKQAQGTDSGCHQAEDLRWQPVGHWGKLAPQCKQRWSTHWFIEWSIHYIRLYLIPLSPLFPLYLLPPNAAPLGRKILTKDADIPYPFRSKPRLIHHAYIRTDIPTPSMGYIPPLLLPAGPEEASITSPYLTDRQRRGRLRAERIERLKAEKDNKKEEIKELPPKVVLFLSTPIHT